MDDERARTLLAQQRAEVLAGLADATRAGAEDRAASQETGAADDPAQAFTTQGVDDAIAESLQRRLAGLDRAEERLRAGTYGRSTRSGHPIPDERLEADPAAELTVEEAAADEA